MYADLIVETKTPRDRQYFTYAIPEEIKDELKIGAIVSVIFGRRKIRGLVIKIHNNKPSYPVKPVSLIFPFSFSKERIQTLLWISKYYFCSPGESLKFFLPPNLVRPQKNLHRHETIYAKISQATVLNSAQAKIYENIIRDWENRKSVHLLRGVTGSGKTEIYIKLIKKVIEENAQAIYLLPEIFLASVILKRLKKVFDHDIEIVHSKISKSELFNIYQRFYKGDLKIIVGARSALSFLPRNLKLIIIDEEHDQSFKQEQSPRYDARLLAEKIAKYEGCRLIFGTATPRLKTYQRSLNKEMTLYELPDRFGQKLPETLIVDMRNEIKAKNYSTLSETLRTALTEVLKSKNQAILFLNRRGLATFVSCRDCGYVELCPNCSIPLVHHLTNHRHSGSVSVSVNQDVLECHQCEYKTGLPARCPECQSTFIKSFGTGIQKIENEIRAFFPDARILRLDSDLTESEFDKISKKVHENDFDILIGTQIIAKGLDLPNVDLVGIISADTALHFPDFHSGELTFQLITQVSGRAGRRGKQGKAIIQSYWPDNQAVKFAAENNYTDFVTEELGVRKTFSYPPFKNIVRLVSQDFDKDKAKRLIRLAAKELSGFEVAGPAPAFYKKIRNRYRYHLIIKFDDKDRENLYRILESFGDKLIIDVDPVNML